MRPDARVSGLRPSIPRAVEPDHGGPPPLGGSGSDELLRNFESMRVHASPQCLKPLLRRRVSLTQGERVVYEGLNEISRHADTSLAESRIRELRGPMPFHSPLSQVACCTDRIGRSAIVGLKVDMPRS